MLILRSVCLCFGVLSLTAVSSWAQNLPAPSQKDGSKTNAPLTAQERLDAIRHSLVEASLQTPTKVLSTSWLDSKGSLRETSSFKNGMQVNSLRVLSYDRDEAGQPKAQLQIEEPTPSVKQQTRQGLKSFWQAFTNVLQFKQLGSDQNKTLISEKANQLSSDPNKTCGKQLKVGLRHLMGVDVWMDDSNPSALTSAVNQLMGEHLTSSNPSGSGQNWRMAANDTQPSMGKTMTAYERTLTSNKPEQLPWHARFAMKTEMLPAPGLLGVNGIKGPGMVVSLLLQVSPREGQKGVFQEMVNLNLELETDAWKPAKLNAESYALLTHQFQQWHSSVSQLLACEAVTPTVTEVQTESIRINAGSESGVRKGDEWLVADPAKFPSQLVGQDGASQMLLAKVDSVSAYHSVLTIVAGSPQSAQVQWRAWPAETLLKEPAVLPPAKGRFAPR
ncbi:MAG: hypothetical protein EBQ58_15530 [Betaproteobacteria bacterium]|nr:hypothetical protein [Betaproteobacteria bacterium]